MSKLKACPCGKTPGLLSITEGSTAKWAFVSGGCCGDWLVEFRTGYNDLSSMELYELAEIAWNEMPRADEASIRREVIEECALLCGGKVNRRAGYHGQWEGYGPSMGEKTGSECSIAIRALAEEPA